MLPGLLPLVRLDDLPIPQICRKMHLDIVGVSFCVFVWERDEVWISNFQTSLVSLWIVSTISNSDLLPIQTFSFASSTTYTPLVRSFHTVFWIPLAEKQCVPAHLCIMELYIWQKNVEWYSIFTTFHKRNQWVQDKKTNLFHDCLSHMLVTVRIAKYLVCQSSEL
jgi:hypothetical protein